MLVWPWVRPRLAGERIVAFARPGKPSKERLPTDALPAFTGVWPELDARETAPKLQQFLKSRRLEDMDIHFQPETESGRSQQKTRRAQVRAANRLGDAGGRLCGTSVLRARHVIDGREDHGCGFQRAVRPGAACVRARCQDRAAMRCGLAARPIVRRQVRQVSGAIFRSRDASHHFRRLPS
jgi:hypothetical protein